MPACRGKKFQSLPEVSSLSLHSHFSAYRRCVGSTVSYLFRTTGQVLGVALSSTLTQSLLAKNLRKRITVPDADEVRLYPLPLPVPPRASSGIRLTRHPTKTDHLQNPRLDGVHPHARPRAKKKSDGQLGAGAQSRVHGADRAYPSLLLLLPLPPPPLPPPPPVSLFRVTRF